MADATSSNAVGSNDVTIELRPLPDKIQVGAGDSQDVRGGKRENSSVEESKKEAGRSSPRRKRSQGASSSKNDDDDDDDDDSDDDYSDDDADHDDYDDMELPKNRHRRRGHVGAALDDDLALPAVKSWQWNPNGLIGQIWTVAAFLFLMYNVIGIPLRMCVNPEEPDWAVCTIVDVSRSSNAENCYCSIVTSAPSNTSLWRSFDNSTTAT